ncbi:MAG: hypothetical protein QME85_11750 [Candidatus Saccharicenans sp.]|nr:hypothetical protein [Candidatus Saccharicenans sp.]
MKKAVSIIIITFIINLSICYAIQADTIYSHWEKTRELWERCIKEPTAENIRIFHDFVREYPPVEPRKNSIIWFLYGGYYRDYIRLGNKDLALAALRLSLVAEKRQARLVLRAVGELSRIDTKLFLEILSEASSFMKENLDKVVISLPEEHDYLLSKAVELKEYRELLSYFSCHELKKRYEAISSVKEKKLRGIRERCLKALKKEIKKTKGCRLIKANDELISKRIKKIWELAEYDEMKIFNTPLERHQVDKILPNKLYKGYYDLVLWPIIEHEVLSGNWEALKGIVDIETSINRAQENLLKDLIVVRPEMFLKFILYQEKYIDEKKRIEPTLVFYGSYRYRIEKYNLLIKSLEQVKDEKYREVRDRYIKNLEWYLDRVEKELEESEKKKKT